MTKAELLKLGLDEEAAGKVEGALKGYASPEDMKGFIPKARFDEVNAEKKSLQEALKERDAQLESLKNSKGDIEALKEQIAGLQTANAEKDKAHAAEIQSLKVNTAVEAELTAAKALNHKAVRALLDLDKPELDADGKLKGLSEQVKKLQGADDSKFMFAGETKGRFKGATLANSGDYEPRHYEGGGIREAMGLSDG